MAETSEKPPKIAVVPPSLRQQAMALLWDHLDVPTRDRLCESFEAEAHTFGERYWFGLIGTFRHDRLTGVAWAQLQPGRSAAIHGPKLRKDEPQSTIRPLLSTVVDQIAMQDVRVAQALRELDHGPEVDSLASAGFQYAADLLYMFSDERSFPTSPPKTQLRFEPISGQLESRLAAVLPRTYVGSRDCPMIDGVRTAEDVLAGYRATGVFSSSRWLIASAPLTADSADSDVGCIILADHPAAQQWELVYMGIAPEARGRGLGLEIVRHAQWLARQARVPRMVLAVDAANEPAVAMYSTADFKTWDRRSVYLRVFEHSGLENS